MKSVIVSLALGLSLVCGSVIAQSASSGAITPAAPASNPAASPSPAAAPSAAAAPAVESVDILKQDQAQRSRDQPGNNAPVWRAVKEGGEHYSSLPALESGVLIQPKAQFPGQARATTAGEAWRHYRNGPLTFYGGWLVLLAVIGIAAVYFAFGQIKVKAAPTGRLIERFTPVERMTHWSMAISFVVLAASGLMMLFGKHVILPVFGHTLFGWITFLCKNVHNFIGPVFTLSIIVFFIVYVKDNFPSRGDLGWLTSLGGLIGKKHVPSGRFNAGEKIWFWAAVVFFGLILTASGFFLDMLLPNVLYTRGNMQVANVIHLIAAVLVTSMSFAHIYIGTLGMQGAYQGMRTGYVDDSWAQEHHELWYDDVASGRVPRVRTKEGASVVGVAPQQAS